MGVSGQRIKINEDRAINKLNRKSYKVREIIKTNDLNDEDREAFIREYFKHSDIFVNSEAKELPKEVKDKLIGIFERGREKRKETLQNLKQFSYLARSTQKEIINEIFGEKITVEQVFKNKEAVQLLDKFMRESKKKCEIKDENENEIKRVCEIENEKKNEGVKQQFRDEILDESIKNLNISPRAFKCLMRARISTIGDIIDLTQGDIRNIRNLGTKTYDEIVEKIHSLGLCFADEVEEQETSTEVVETVEQQEQNQSKNQDIIIEENRKEIEETEEEPANEEDTIENIDSQEQNEDFELGRLVNQLNERYQVKAKEKQANQAVQAQLNHEIERITKENISSREKISKLQSIINENGKFLSEIGELEPLEQRLKIAQEEIAKKEQEEQELKAKLKNTQEKEEIIDKDIGEIKRKVHDSLE